MTVEVYGSVNREITWLALVLPLNYADVTRLAYEVITPSLSSRRTTHITYWSSSPARMRPKLLAYCLRHPVSHLLFV
jgi:hypothetical protein